MPLPTSKACSKCGLDLPLERFSKAKTGRYGLRGECKACQVASRIKRDIVVDRPKTFTCTSCGVEKDYTTDNFKKSKSGKYGLSTECRCCLNVRNAAWAREHPETREKWRKNNLDKVRKSSRESSKRLYWKFREYQKKWAELNKDRRSKQAAKWYAENKPRLSIIRKEWRERNKDKLRVYTMEYRARILGSSGTHTSEDIQRLLNLQKRKCANCYEALTTYHVDHIFPISKGGGNDVSNLQILCPTCNRRKAAKDPVAFANENGRLL